jgi:hypothetical protein
MRFFAVLFATIVVACMSLGIIYFWGMGRVYPKYDHPFFTPAKPWVVLPRTLFNDPSIQRRDPNFIEWIDVYRNKENTLVIDKLESTELLSEAMPKLKGRRVILNIASNVEDIDRQMSAFLAPYLENTSVLIQSEYDVVLRATKEESANMPFGSSQSDRLRFNTFEGMAPWPGGLLPATPFHGDIYISPLKWKNISLVNSRIVQEVHRRQKYVILGPLRQNSELEQAQSLAPDGFILENKDVLEQFLSSKGSF